MKRFNKIFNTGSKDKDDSDEDSMIIKKKSSLL